MDGYELTTRQSGDAQRDDTVSGVVSGVVYQNEQNGYAVIRVDSDDYEDEVIVVGSAPFVAAGEWIVAKGVWSRHPSYGEQLKAEFIERSLPDDEDSMLAYLSSGVVKGVGTGLAAGALLGAAGMLAFGNKKSLRKKSRRLVDSMADMADNVKYMFK